MPSAWCRGTTCSWRPDLSVNSPRFTAWASTCARRAARAGGQRRQLRSSASGSNRSPGGTVAFDVVYTLGRPPHLHRTPAGRDLRRPARRRPARRDARLRRLLPQRPLPGDGRRATALPGPDRRVDHARRPGPRHVDDPPRHARHVGDVPPPGRAGDHRRQRRPDVAAVASSSASAPAGTRTSTRPTASRSRTSASASTVSRSSWRSSPGCGDTPLGETFDFTRPALALHDSPALPKPVQADGPPIIIGGDGRARTPQLAARFAAEFNMPFCRSSCSVEQCAPGASTACEAIDRDPASMTFSAAVVVCCGADEAEFRRRAAAIGRDLEQLRRIGVAGTTDEVGGDVREWNAAGADRIYLQVLDLSDLEHLDAHRGQLAPTELDRPRYLQIGIACLHCATWQQNVDRKDDDRLNTRRPWQRGVPKAAPFVTISKRCGPTSRNEAASARPIRSTSGSPRSTTSCRRRRARRTAIDAGAARPAEPNWHRKSAASTSTRSRRPFVNVAKAYGERQGISYASWRDVGVSAPVLKRAGISRGA